LPFKVYDVIDGQQRITTICLFLLALSNMNKPVIKDNYIKCGDIYRVKLGGLNAKFFEDLVDGKNPQPDLKTNKLLKDCLEYFKNQISNCDEDELDDLSKYVQNDTFFLEFIVQDQILAVKAFESLNDRGKPLTIMDKTKSYLMFISLRHLANNVNNNLNNKINDAFGNIFAGYDIIKEIGEQENIDYIRSDRFTEDELLRFFYHYFAFYILQKYKLPTAYNYDANVDDVFETFLKGACNHLKNNQVDLNKFIEEFLDGFEKFVSSFKDVIERVKTDCRYKKLFSFLGLNTRVYPLLISLQTKNMLNDSILELIETLDLRVYKIRGTDPRAGLYNDVIAKIKDTSQIDPINKGIESFIKYFMPDDLFKHYLSQSIYDNPATKFILWEYQKRLDENFNDCDSNLYNDCQKEHVLAQNPKTAFPAYGFSDQEEYVANINRLGNLCLLEQKLNKQCQNQLPEQKKKYYQQSQIPGTKKLGFSDVPFDKADIDKITQDIINFCLKRWKI